MPAKPEITNPSPMATIFYSRKTGLPNYSSEEFSTFLQVPLDGVTDEKELEALLDSQAAFLKAWVLKELNISYTIDPQNNVVMGEVLTAAEKPKSKTYPAKGGPSKAIKTNQAGPTDKAVLWDLLAAAEGPYAAKNGAAYYKASTGESIFDNRADKRNPNSPDAKFADSGAGLWLDKAPEGFVWPGE